MDLTSKSNPGSAAEHFDVPLPLWSVWLQYTLLKLKDTYSPKSTHSVESKGTKLQSTIYHILQSKVWNTQFQTVISEVYVMSKNAT